MIGWLITAASLIGVLLNIHHDRRCFIVWGLTKYINETLDNAHQSGVYNKASPQSACNAMRALTTTHLLTKGRIMADSQPTLNTPAFQPVRFYLSSRYGRRDEMRVISRHLELAGHIPVCRWIASNHDVNSFDGIYLSAKQRRQIAVDDLQDVTACDWLIAFSELECSPYGRGGRHVEFGYAMALRKRMIVVGHLENVFHCTHDVEFIGGASDLYDLFGVNQPSETTEYKRMSGFSNYLIGSDGTVWSRNKSRRSATPFIHDSTVWWPVKLSVLGGRKYFYPQNGGDETKIAKRVSIAVIEAFTGPRPEPYLECRHLNGNPKDNRISNLLWGTPDENQMDRVRHGTTNRGERQGMSRLTSEDVKTIRREVESGTSVLSLSKRFDVSRTYIRSIADKKAWSWLE